MLHDNDDGDEVKSVKCCKSKPKECKQSGRYYLYKAFYITAATPIIASWIAGTVLANNIVSKLFAIFCPLYSWYLVIFKIIDFNGWR